MSNSGSNEKRFPTVDRRTARQRADDIRLAAIKNEGSVNWANRVMTEAEKRAAAANSSEFPHPPTSANTVLGPYKPPTEPDEPVYSGEDLREMGRRYDQDEKIVKAVKKEHRQLALIVGTFLFLVAAGLFLQAYDYLSSLPPQNTETPIHTPTRIKPTEKPSTITPTPTRFSIIQRGNQRVIIPANSVPLITPMANGDKMIYVATYTPTPND